jgi:hypothetical protein
LARTHPLLQTLQEKMIKKERKKKHPTREPPKSKQKTTPKSSKCTMGRSPKRKYQVT